MVADVASPGQVAQARAAPSWERLGELMEAALAADGDMDLGPPGVSAADVALVEALEGMKQQGGEGAPRFFNSARLEPYRASRADLAVYARMQEKVGVFVGWIRGGW